MVSSVYARPNAHHYPTPALTHTQSNTQYLKEAYGLSVSPTNASLTQGGMPNENEWPSLNNAMFSVDQHDRSASQQRAQLGRRSTNLMNQQQQLSRRPASIGRVGMPQDNVRAIGNVQQQMNAAAAQQQLQQQQAINNGAAKNPKLYKTELCRSWMDNNGVCNYGTRCQYAHGESEKRPIPRHPKYKSEACKSYHQTGFCMYGARCHFIHNEEPHLLAQMVAANAAVSSSAQQQLGQPQSPMRPSNLFTNTTAAGVCPSPTLGAQNRATPVGLGPIGSSPNNPNNIARVASLAASAYNQNPNFFSHQFQTQLQIFNDGLKNPSMNDGNATPIQANVDIGSNGDSPIPSSNDSGTESPVCSFSPGSELDDPTFFFARKQLEATKSVGPKLTQNSAPFNLLPSSLNSDFESGFSSSSSTSSTGTKSLNSPVIGSPPHVSTTWSNGPAVGTPTSSAVGRLPVFERLSSNGM